MTIQLASADKHGKSKATLADALNKDAGSVRFCEPTPFSDRYFTGAAIQPGEGFPVVMDPDTRRRFAKVVRNAKGVFSVL